MDQAALYLPIDRRIAIASGQQLPDRTNGAALFADISGFTPLTEALARDLGRRRGAEELTHYLNTIYSALIAEVHRYRGTVIVFSGDAITCWFDEARFSGNEQSESADPALPSVPAALRAVACALAMQEVMQPFQHLETPSGTLIELAIKVAVTAGPARRFCVGDPQIQLMDTLAGHTLERLAAAEHLAEKGEVVVGVEVVEQAGDLIGVQEWREEPETSLRVAVVAGMTAVVSPDPWPELPEDVLTKQRTRPWLLREVYEQLRGDQGAFLAELRPVVVLFGRFGGIDFDGDELAGSRLDGFIRWAQRITNRYEGALLQLTIGDKGCYFYCSFGAPIAHDDDVMRAASAALDLRYPPALLGATPLQIGVSQGSLRTGAYGGTTRRTYGVIGDDVNLAARLMSKAEPGQILVSDRVADALRARYEIQDIGEFTVKGKQRLIRAALVLGRRTAPVARAAAFFGELIGRDAELAEVLQAVEHIFARAGRVVRIQGEAGIGKSHFVAELLEQIGIRGVHTALGNCLSTTESVPYAPWRQIMRALLGLPPTIESGDEAQAKAIHAVGELVQAANPEWLLRLPLLGDLIGLPIPDNATTAAFEPKLRQSALFDLVGDIVQHWSAERPLALIIDDVHWIDEASRGMTIAVARSIERSATLLMLVHRPPIDQQQILPELDPLPIHQRFMLAELSPEGIGALMAKRLDGSVNRLAVAFIQSECQGNPFFAEELIDSLREGGDLYRREGGEWFLSSRIFEALRQAGCLVREEGEWTLAPDVSLSTANLGLPDSIHGVVLSRIDRLPSSHKLTLKVASVIGRSFAFELLVKVHPSGLLFETLFEELSLLDERDFTRLEIESRLIYLFKHTVTQGAAYETLLFDQRRQLHRLVGEALESLAPEAVTQLAHHSFASEDWLRALRYQIAAGQLARHLFANDDAIEHFRRALSCAANLPPEQTREQRLEIRLALGELLTITGQYEEALAHLDHALSLATIRNDRDAQALACRLTARVYEKRGEYERVYEWSTRGLEALQNQDTLEAAELLLLEALIAMRQGDGERTSSYCERSLSIGEKLAAPTVAAQAYSVLGLLDVQRGRFSSAIEHLTRASQLYQQAEDIYNQAKAYNNIGNAYFGLAQMDQAEEHYQRARLIFQRVGDVYWFGVLSNNLGGIARRRGRLNDALALFQEAMSSFEQIGVALYVLGIVQMNLGHTAVEQGNLAAARGYLERSQSFFDQATARDFLAELRRYNAELALAEQHLDEAERQIAESLRLAREMSMRNEEGISLVVAAAIRLAHGESVAAEGLLQEAITIQSEVGDEYELARARLALARAYATRGDRAAALAELELSEPVFERLGATPELEAARLLRNS